MDKLKKAARSSEFWLALVYGVGEAAVAANVLPADTWSAFKSNGLVTYVLGRLVSKVAKKGEVASV